jgi:hypothetical protein
MGPLRLKTWHHVIFSESGGMEILSAICTVDIQSSSELSRAKV